MNQFSAKNKIFILLATWLGLSAAMLLFFFNLLDNSNRNNVDAMFDQKKDLTILKAERQSFVQAQADLLRLSKEIHQPENFFSSDITLVNEIRTLENLGTEYNLQMQLSGVSGTIGTVPKAKTSTALGVIPFTISLSGEFQNVVDFVEVLENLDFITNVNNLSVNAGANGQVNASLAANFYLKKWH